MIEFPRSLPIPEEVIEIARHLEDAGFETWCVGGAVRDNLLGSRNKDFDLATAATPEQVQAQFAHTVPVGVEHGTVAVLDRHRKPHEVTTFRQDIETDGRHAVVRFGASLDEDLARRDFTINAIAYHPLRREWRDRFEGRKDLEARVVRAVGDPAQRFREDYLRILRALRFAARFGFTIDAATWTAMLEGNAGLTQLSAERVRDEWFKGLESAERPSRAVTLWRDAGGLTHWLPEIVADRAEHLDDFPSRDPVLMTAFLSADPEVTLTRLRCSNAHIARGRAIGKLRGKSPDPRSKPAVRRWMSEAGKAVDDLLIIERIENPSNATLLDAVISTVRATGAPLSLGDLAVTGDDLRQAGYPAGKTMGATLRQLLDEVLEDPAKNTREELLRIAGELAAKGVR